MTLLESERSAAPRWSSFPTTTVSSAADECLGLVEATGLFLDPWQVDVFTAALGERADGKWSAFEVGLLVPRQSGKGAILEARELAGLFVLGERLILHSAHRLDTAKEAYLRIRDLIENTPDLHRQVKRYPDNNQERGIVLHNGSRLLFGSRDKGGKRGFSGDVVILDEAYNLSDDIMAALVPTMASRPNPQLWYTSSAPLEETQNPESSVLLKIIKRGRGGESKRLAYMEWCADESDASDDVEAWKRANPGFGIRISQEFIENERAVMSDEAFRRERLGLWIDPAKLAASAMPNWDACADASSAIAGTPAFALDVSFDRSSASFAAAGPSTVDGLHVEVADTRPGTGWCVERAVALQEKHGGVLLVAKGSPASSLVPALEAAGVNVDEVSTEDHARAVGDLRDAVTDGRIRHLGQGSLNAAVAAATFRAYGDAVLWSRKSSTGDISPLVAITLAAAGVRDSQVEPFMFIS
jgi:hypothetical protein